MKKQKPKRRIFIPGPDRRNVKRGTEWLSKMIKASEENRLIESVVDEMLPVVKREREVGEEG